MENTATLDAAADTPDAASFIPRSGKTFPSVTGLQGARLQTFATQVNPFDIEDVLGHDPRSRNLKQVRDARLRFLYLHVQRKTSEERVRDLIRYYEERVFRAHPILGAIPALSIAIEQPVEFSPVSGSPSLGKMVLETGRLNCRLMLDGLARTTALLDQVDIVMGEKLPPADGKLLRAYLEKCAVPVIFYAPQIGQPAFSQEEMEQIFCDFNFRVRVVSPKDAMALDHSDPYVAMTRYLAEHCDAIKNHGGMETKKASLGSKSTAIVVQPVLLRFVRGAIEGEEYLEAAINTQVENPQLTVATADRIQTSLANFLDALVDAMGQRWSDHSSMHLSSPGWQVIALLYHDVAMRLRKDDQAVKKFAGAIARLDWRRDGALFAPLMVSKLDPETGVTKTTMQGAGASTRRTLIEALRKEFGLTEQLANLVV